MSIDAQADVCMFVCFSVGLFVSFVWFTVFACFFVQAELTVKHWRSSDEHEKNLSGDFDLMGLGYAQSADGWLYITQLLCTQCKRVPEQLKEWHVDFKTPGRAWAGQ